MINTDKIIAQLAEKYKLPKFVVEAIVKSQFRFLQKQMEAGEYKGVRLHKLGLFMVKPKRVELLNLRFEKAKLKKENEQTSDNK